MVIELANWFRVIVGWTAIPCLMILSIMFYKNQRNKGRLTLLIGFIALATGQLLQLLSPAKMSLDESGNILSSSGLPSSWYVGSTVFSLGMLIVVVGFGLITFKKQTTT